MFPTVTNTSEMRRKTIIDGSMEGQNSAHITAGPGSARNLNLRVSSHRQGSVGDGFRIIVGGLRLQYAWPSSFDRLKVSSPLVAAVADQPAFIDRSHLIAHRAALSALLRG
jgi:hypothetical protein